VFEETLAEYGRLSAQLATARDTEAAARAWAAHLDRLEAEGGPLANPLPAADYHALAESHRLAAVHERIVADHRRMLVDAGGGNADLLTAHDRALERLAERREDAAERLRAWETHRDNADALLAWLRRVEREKSALGLRSVRLDQMDQVLLRIAVRNAENVERPLISSPPFQRRRNQVSEEKR
jgi:hypothetical protein